MKGFEKRLVAFTLYYSTVNTRNIILIIPVIIQHRHKRKPQKRIFLCRLSNEIKSGENKGRFFLSNFKISPIRAGEKKGRRK